MSFRLYTDKDSGSRAVCAALREAGLTVLRTEEAGNALLSDRLQLEYATANGLTIYTANYADFARLHNEWMSGGRHHAGIIGRVRQRVGVGTEIRALLALAAQFDPDDLRDSFVHLDRYFRVS